MQAAYVTHHRAAHHDVVEVGDDEISVVDVNVQAEAGEEQAGEPANGKQADEAQGVDHGRVPGDGTFIKRRSPIEHFYRRGDGDQIAEEGKGQGRISGFPGDKHV